MLQTHPNAPTECFNNLLTEGEENLHKSGKRLVSYSEDGRKALAKASPAKLKVRWLATSKERSQLFGFVPLRASADCRLPAEP